jgi:AraC-like DNA-binding protein
MPISFEGATVVELSKAGKLWRLDIKPHDVFVIPPNTNRRYLSKAPLRHYYLIFRFPVESALAECVELPAIIPTGPHAATVRRDLDAIIDLRETDVFESELLARLTLWRLGRLARFAANAQQGGDAAVQATLERIRRDIADYRITPEALAEAVGLSRRRLDQLFTSIVGKPVSACIRDRRVQLAKDLLCQTALPIHLVSAQVGMPDPQAFNKFIRRYCGKSPTAVRSTISEA